MLKLALLPWVVPVVAIPVTTFVVAAGNQARSSTSASGIKAFPTGPVLYDNLENLFYVEHEMKQLFPIQSTFFRYTEIDETLRKIQNMRIPQPKWWEEMLEIL